MNNTLTPKTCNYEINSMGDIFTALNDVCDNEKSYTDKELSIAISDIHDFCLGGKTGRDVYFITHTRSEKLVKKRAQKYCKKHKIKLEDYNGVLPYKQYVIDLTSDLMRNEKLKKLTDNIKGEEHDHIISEDEKWWEFHEKTKIPYGKTRTR